jgi:hypothetical protein
MPILLQRDVANAAHWAMNTRSKSYGGGRPVASNRGGPLFCGERKAVSGQRETAALVAFFALSRETVSLALKTAAFARR